MAMLILKWPKIRNGTAKENLIRLGNLLPEETIHSGMILACTQLKAVAANATEAKKVAGIYFLENSVKKEELTTDNKNFGYYRLPYAKVYTTYTPNEVWKLGIKIEKIG